MDVAGLHVTMGRSACHITGAEQTVDMTRLCVMETHVRHNSMTAADTDVMHSVCLVGMVLDSVYPVLVMLVYLLMHSVYPVVLPIDVVVAVRSCWRIAMHCYVAVVCMLVTVGMTVAVGTAAVVVVDMAVVTVDMCVVVVVVVVVVAAAVAVVVHTSPHRYTV